MPKKPTTTSKRKRLDWEAIEKEYRAGALSIRAIADAFGCTDTAIRKKAKANGWTRDLSDKVRAQVRTELVRAEVRSPEEAARTEREIVQAAATRGVEVVRQHRTLLHRTAKVADTLLVSLEQDLANKETSRGEATATLQRITMSLSRLIPLERQAFNLDDGGKDTEQGDDGMSHDLQELVDGLLGSGPNNHE